MVESEEAIYMPPPPPYKPKKRDCFGVSMGSEHHQFDLVCWAPLSFSVFLQQRVFRSINLHVGI